MRYSRDAQERRITRNEDWYDKAPGYRQLHRGVSGYLVYFAAWKKHIAFYPVTPGLEKAFGKEIAPYRSGKGTLKFPLGNPMPIPLIKRIVEFRATEARAKSTAKKPSR